MFAEYAQWRQKLEEIEQKMKKEVTFWREQANQFEKSNYKLENDIQKM